MAFIALSSILLCKRIWSWIMKSYGNLYHYFLLKRLRNLPTLFHIAEPMSNTSIHISFWKEFQYSKVCNDLIIIWYEKSSNCPDTYSYILIKYHEVKVFNENTQKFTIFSEVNKNWIHSPKVLHLYRKIYLKIN